MDVAASRVAFEIGGFSGFQLGLDDTCAADEDCPAGLVCVDGACATPACVGDEGCEPWAHCALNACELDPGACGADVDCVAHRRCAEHLCVLRDGRCDGDGDCRLHERCAANTCVLREGRCETDAQCDPDRTCESDHRCVLRPNRCRVDDDCGWNIKQCVGGTCGLKPGRCILDTDCATSGERCRNNTCEPPLSECSIDGDCSPPAICSSGGCVLGPGTCRGDSDCGSGEHCLANVCNHVCNEQGCPATLTCAGTGFTCDCPELAKSATLFLPGIGWKRTACAPVALAPTMWHAPVESVLLANGKVLVVGSAASAVYDPATNGWTATGARTFQGGVARAAGAKVLVTNGTRAETYDAATNAWTATGAVATPRTSFALASTTNGRVLLVGGAPGTSRSEALASVELYDPATNAWTATGALAATRARAVAATLPDGRVLVAGGANATEVWTSGLAARYVAEIWNPQTGTWSAAGTIASAFLGRYLFTLTPLGNGDVVLVGGLDGDARDSALTEILRAGTLAWERAADTPILRHGAALLADGRVLAVGKTLTTMRAALLDPVTKTWSTLRDPPRDRVGTTPVKLPNGDVLFAGGVAD